MVEPRWLAEQEQHAWRAHLDGTRLLLRRLDRELTDDAGLSLADYDLLVRLSEAPGHRLRMRELADQAFATRSGVTRAVTRFEKAGWVRRVVCAEDRRGMNAELTPVGLAKLAAAAPGHVAAVRAALFDPLDPVEVEHLREIGTRLRAHLLERDS